MTVVLAIDGGINMKKMHPDFETRMMWKGQTGLPMNVAIDDGYAYNRVDAPKFSSSPSGPLS